MTNTIDESQAPLYTALAEIRGRHSFHMPGHKGNADYLPLELGMDVTELNITDDLYSAQGAIAKAQIMAAGSAGAANTIFLTNGATCGIHAMLGYCEARSKKIVISRAAHKSAINACILFGLEPVWIDSYYDDGGAPFTPTEAVLSVIEANQDASAVLITRPDYFGRVCDLTPIVKAAHAADMLVFVDEAHGAHFNWAGRELLSGNSSADMELSAMRSGADMCVQSAHKTLNALTGSAYLHMNKSIDAKEVLRYVELIQSSSPSFLLMASLDYARAWMDRFGRDALIGLAKRCEALETDAEAISGLIAARSYFSTATDRTRIALDVSGRGITGYDAQQFLTEQGIDIEMADSRRIVMICSVADEDSDFDALLKALKLLPQNAGEFTMPHLMPNITGVKVCSPREAALSKTVLLPIAQANGRIAARSVAIYPPGIPQIVPGEAFTPDVIEHLIKAHNQGASVSGLDDGYVTVVA